jgi:V/A-type H+-transporting ATPase subunit F
MSGLRTMVIGNENCVLGYSLLGIAGRVANTPEEMDEALSAALATANVGILLISSEVAALSRARVDRLKVNSIRPLVVEIPGQDPAHGLRSLKDLVQTAIGISIGN